METHGRDGGGTFVPHRSTIVFYLNEYVCLLLRDRAWFLIHSSTYYLSPLHVVHRDMEPFPTNCLPYPLSPYLFVLFFLYSFLSNAARERGCPFHAPKRSVPFLIIISTYLTYSVFRIFSRLVRSWVVEHLHISQTTKHFVNQLSLKYASTPRPWSS